MVGLEHAIERVGQDGGLAELLHEGVFEGGEGDLGVGVVGAQAHGDSVTGVGVGLHIY